MYENLTYEAILQRMLARVNTGVDKREGSLLYSTLAPEAWELAQSYIGIDYVYNSTFADTAPRTELLLRAKERGISPKESTAAILKGVFNTDIPLFSRFSLGDLNYMITEKISSGVYKMQCESVGEAGNKKFGELVPIEYIEGLESAELTELLIPGTDEEDTETFRTRYFNSFKSLAFGGNKADYIEKIGSISGIGGVKVYRVSGQDYNVLVYIVNSEYAVPSVELINEVQGTIDPTQDGEGAGMAPIGHIVSIQGVQAFTVNVSTIVTLDTGYEWADVSAAVNTSIDSYFHSLSEGWANTENLIIRISMLEANILNVIGVLDITGTRLNDAASNITLTNKQIPARGAVYAST